LANNHLRHFKINDSIMTHSVVVYLNTLLNIIKIKSKTILFQTPVLIIANTEIILTEQVLEVCKG